MEVREERTKKKKEFDLENRETLIFRRRTKSFFDAKTLLESAKKKKKKEGRLRVNLLTLVRETWVGPVKLSERYSTD